MKKVKLKNIASINSGYQFRKSPPEFSSGNIRYIQMRDINEANDINIDSVIFVDLDEDTYLPRQLNQNDILFKNRGSINNAAIFNYSETTIASHQFQIIRLKSNSVLPEFLQWFLNHKAAQTYFKSNATGTGTSIIQKKVIEELDIIIPKIEEQQKIINLNTLLSKYTDLMKNQIEKYTTLINTTLTNYLKETEEI